MRQKAIRYGALGLALLTWGCRKQDPSPAERLVGEWQWVRSIGGFTGRMVDKPQPGQVVTLRFTADGQWQQCSQGKCTDLMPYTVGRKTSMLGDERLILTLHRKIYLAPPDNGFHVMLFDHILEEYSDTLKFADNYPDGYGATYFRR